MDCEVYKWMRIIYRTITNKNFLNLCLIILMVHKKYEKLKKLFYPILKWHNNIYFLSKMEINLFIN